MSPERPEGDHSSDTSSGIEGLELIETVRATAPHQGVLYEVSSTDPGTFVLVGVGILAVANTRAGTS